MSDKHTPEALLLQFNFVNYSVFEKLQSYFRLIGNSEQLHGLDIGWQEFNTDLKRVHTANTNNQTDC